MKTRRRTTKASAWETLGLIGLIVMFCLMANPTYGQTSERTVTGVVNSNDGPVYGATIVLKDDASVGVVSNQKGEFTFPRALKEDDVLVVSYLGYETDEVKITGDMSFIQPFLEDIPIIVVASLRTKEASTPEFQNKN